MVKFNLGWNSLADWDEEIIPMKDEAELMEQLRAGRITIGDRSKVRLLLGSDGSELRRTGSTDHQCAGNADRVDAGFARQLQDGADQGMSADTIAIVASVLVGAAGYLVQVRMQRCCAFIMFGCSCSDAEI